MPVHSFYPHLRPRDLHSFPTRRSSDLVGVDETGRLADTDLRRRITEHLMDERAFQLTGMRAAAETRSNSGPSADRKSTRLNSSHSQISYAVFCLKKKKNRLIQAIHLIP